MEFIRNDGGRKDAGFIGSAGDCVTRAIAIVTGKAYLEVYNDLHQAIKTFASTSRSRAAKRAGRGQGMKGTTPRNGVAKAVFHKYLLGLGYKWVPTMFVGKGCTVHLRSDELPKGKLIVRVSRHLTAVIDGVINDTFNPSERGSTIYHLNYPKDELPKGAKLMENGNGYSYTPERCVYGYYVKI